jgi:hypothetical protein
MVYTFSPEQVARLDACRVQFNRLTRQRLTIQQFINETINQTIGDCEAAADAVRLAMPERRSRHVH